MLAMIIREVWRCIPSVPGMLASSDGRIMAEPIFDRPLPYGGTRDYYGTPWIGTWAVGTGGGRYTIHFRGKTYKVARLVCEAFHGTPPEGKPVCLHLDENSRNNKPANLAWGTQKENLNAPGFLRYCRSRRRMLAAIDDGDAAHEP